MSIPTLSSSHVFGLNSNIQGNAFFIDESVVLYPVGHQLVQYNFEKKTQKILNIQLDGDHMSCMAVYLPENLIAVGTKAASEQSFAVVNIYELHTGKRKKVYKTGDSTRSFVSISFSGDGRFVFAQGSAPDWNIYCWSMEKPKLVYSTKSTSGQLEIRKMSANAFDTGASTHICVTGVNIFRLFRFQDNVIKLIHQMKIDHEMRAHAWISTTRVACGTMDSKILIFEEGELISELQYLPNLNAKSVILEEGSLQPAITTISSFQNGLFIGLNNGTMLYYEKIDDHPFYRKKKEEVFDESPVLHISWNSREDRAIVTLKSNQIYLFQIEADQKGESIKYDRLSNSVHSGPINSMDACMTKPLLITSGSDKSIRLWNYVENTLEVVNHFEEAANCIAIHPNGLYVLAGFPSALKLMAILLDDIRTYWEVPIKSARGCNFSHGGQFFAVITAINVTIYDTWSFKIVGVLRGGASRIVGMHWSDDDTRLATYCNDGSIQHWTSFGFTKVFDTTVDGNVSSYTLNANSSTSYILGQDNIVREVVNGSVMRSATPKTPLKQLLLSNSCGMMFQTTESGKVRALKFPFNPEGSLTDEATEYSFSESPIRQIQFSLNGRYLFSAGEDGTLWIHKIHDKEGRVKTKDWEFSDEILVTKSDLRDNYKYLADLRQQVEEMKMQGESAFVNKDLLHESKMQDIVLHHQKDIEVVQAVIDRLKEETNQVLKKNNEELANLRLENDLESQELNTAFLKKMETEQTRYEELMERRKALEMQWESKMIQIHQSHKHDSNELSKFFSKEMDEKNLQEEKLRKDAAQAKEKHETNLQEIEKDIDNELLELTFGFETKLKEERSMFASVQDDNNLMKATFEKLQIQIEEGKTELNTCAIQNRKLAGIIRALEGDVLGLKGEIRERDETIIDKDKRIQDLRKKNQELEKFKFVLDYKIVELRRQEEPRERDMEQLKETLKLMNEELKSVSQNKLSLDREYKEMIMTNYGTQLHSSSEQWKVNHLQKSIMNFKSDMQKVSHLLISGSQNEWKRACMDLYHKYRDLEEVPVTPPQDALPKYTESELLAVLATPKDQKPKDNSSFEEGKEAEYNRGRKQLEKTIDILKCEAKKAEQKRKKDALKMVEEGTILTRELNALRKGLQEKRKRIGEIEEAQRRGISLSQFLRREIESKGKDHFLKRKETIGEEIKTTIMPLPPILPPKDVL